MKVKDLINKLSKLDLDKEIVITDPESVDWYNFNISKEISFYTLDLTTLFKERTSK